MALAAILLVLVLTPFLLVLRKDPADYRAFKALTDTRDRQRRFRIWTLKSFLLCGFSTLVALVILGRLSALVTLPPEFQRFAAFLRAHGPGPAATTGFLTGMAIASIAGIIVGIYSARRKQKKQALKPVHSDPVTLGDIAPLLPRNWAEIAHAAVMSLNAGFSEELYFRLLLPLLLAILIGHAVPAFFFAAILFGLAHYYQGIIGVAVTTFIGFIMVAIYLLTGSIWAAVATHAFIDLVGLVIRPALTRLFTPKQAA